MTIAQGLNLGQGLDDISLYLVPYVGDVPLAEGLPKEHQWPIQEGCLSALKNHHPTSSPLYDNYGVSDRDCGVGDESNGKGFTIAFVTNTAVTITDAIIIIKKSS